MITNTAARGEPRAPVSQTFLSGSALYKLARVPYFSQPADCAATPTRVNNPRGSFEEKDVADVISLIFPAFNPGPIVERTWDSVRDFIAVRRDPWEAIFVCDGCTDGTAERLETLSLEAADPRLRVVGYGRNRGKGHAVRVGLLAATGSVRIFTDIDLAYSFDDIARLADELQRGAQLAVGSRDHPDSLVQVPVRHLAYIAKRRKQSRIFGGLARRMLPLTLNDTQAGLKGMTAAVAERVLPNLTCDGFGFDCELLTACARYGIPVTEMPVCVRYDDAVSSTGGLKTIATMIRELWRIRRRWPKSGFPAPADDAARRLLIRVA